ncbi:MAG: hypothetical protein RTV31_05805 [Candidatus Thorarchaeota archaeon]
MSLKKGEWFANLSIYGVTPSVTLTPYAQVCYSGLGDLAALNS